MSNGMNIIRYIINFTVIKSYDSIVGAIQTCTVNRVIDMINIISMWSHDNNTLI